MRRLLLFLLTCLLLLLPALAQVPSGVLISELLTDPLGTDTGGEFVELVNLGENAVDVSDWEIDPDQLPYYVLPSGTTLAPHGTLTILLRQSGTNTPQNLYTGTSFGSTNMGNTKGTVTLYRPGGHDAAHLEDFVQWGEGYLTHSMEAGETGLFDPAVFLSVATEGQSFSRICDDTTPACFQTQVPSAGLPSMTFTPPPAIETGVILLPAPQEPVLRLAYVAMNNPNGTADDIGILVTDDGNGGTGTVLRGGEVRVDAQRFALAETAVRTGDMIHLSLGNANARADIGETIFKVWSEVTGLVATSEQVLLYDGQGRLVDGVCWAKEPVAQNELADMAMIQRDIWHGACIDSTLVLSGAVLKRRPGTMSQSPAADQWDITLPPTPIPTPPEIMPSTEVHSPTCTGTLEGVHIAEILPNPDGADTGAEWVELVNMSNQEALLCHLSLDDDVGGSTPYALSGLTIPAGGRLVVNDTQSKLSLGNSADSVRLLSDAGTVLETISYEDAPSGKSYSRIE